MNLISLLFLLGALAVLFKFVAQPLIDNAKMEKKLQGIPYSKGRYPVIGHVLEMLAGRPWKIFKGLPFDMQSDFGRNTKLL